MSEAGGETSPTGLPWAGPRWDGTGMGMGCVRIAGVSARPAPERAPYPWPDIYLIFSCLIQGRFLFRLSFFGQLGTDAGREARYESSSSWVHFCSILSHV